MGTFTTKTGVSAAVLALALIGGLTGCSTNSSGGKAADVPNFSGPHKEQFREAWLETDSEVLHDIMRDEAVSDFEWTEVKSSFEGCVSKAGMQLKSVEEDGGFNVVYNGVSQETGDKEIERCKKDSGLTAIGFLRNEMITNPENLDPAEIIAACLVRAKVVEPGYSKNDYLRDVEASGDNGFAINYTGSKEAGDQAVITCNEDPTNSFK